MSGFADYYDDLASRVYTVIRSTRNQRTKEAIALRVNARRINPVSVGVMFGTAVRLGLETRAAAEGKAVIIERGYCFTTTKVDAAERRMIKRLTYHATHGVNLDHDGNGVNLLRASTEPIHAVLANEARIAADSARLTVARMNDLRLQITARDKAIRAKTRARDKARQKRLRLAR